MIAIDLPWPPSANRLWRVGRRRRKGGKPLVYPAPAYAEWQRQAALEWLPQRPKFFAMMAGPFKAKLVLCPPPSLRNRKWDRDNRAKACLDFAQKNQIIKDDSLCQEITIRSGTEEEAPMGARLFLEPVKI